MNFLHGGPKNRFRIAGECTLKASECLRLTAAALAAFAAALFYRFARRGVHLAIPCPLGQGAAFRTRYLLIVSFYKFFKRKTAIFASIGIDGHGSPLEPGFDFFGRRIYYTPAL